MTDHFVDLREVVAGMDALLCTLAGDQIEVETVLDAASALDRVGGNRELLRQLAGVFREDCSQLIEQIQAALQEGDAVRLHEAAHTLKGMVGFFAAPVATEAARKLEAIGQTGELTRAEESLECLIREIERVQNVLASVFSAD